MNDYYKRFRGSIHDDITSLIVAVNLERMLNSGPTVHSYSYRKQISISQKDLVEFCCSLVSQPIVNYSFNDDGEVAFFSIVSETAIFQADLISYKYDNDEEGDTHIKSGSEISVTLFYVEEQVKDKLHDYLSSFSVIKASEVPIQFAFYSHDGPSFKTRKFDRLPFQSIKENYMPSVQKSFSSLIKTIDESSHGVVLLSGPVGTGKSFLIRSLLSEVKRKAVVVTPPTSFLVDVGSLSVVCTKYPKSLVILEDVGEMLAIGRMSTDVNATSNLLNVTDGLLSLLMDTIIIITFNHSMSDINDAITRPGRCLAKITVPELDHEHASKLLDFEIPIGKYTLAEVYEMKRLGFPLEITKRPLGLRLN